MSLNSGDRDDSLEYISLKADNIADFLRSVRHGDFDLSVLTNITLSDIDLPKLPKEFLKLKNLSRITIEHCGLLVFPSELGELEKLGDLTITGAVFSKIPGSLKTWGNLSYLSISACREVTQIHGLPPNLEYLNISWTGLRDIPETVYKLRHLLKLVANGLKLSFFPERLFEMTGLATLFLDNNYLQEVPYDIKKLAGLEELWLGDNKMYSFPDAVLELPLLRELNLSGNCLKEIPPDIGRLQLLDTLDLGCNDFTEFPGTLFSLQKLVSLSFSNSPSYYARELPCRNRITIIPNEILQLKNLSVLDPFGNPIGNVPAEIVEGGLDAIKNYLEATQEADSEEYLYEAKMVMVGRGNVGKTVLTKKLTDPAYRLSYNKSTEGISVLKTPFFVDMSPAEKAFRFTIWDFGGQEKYDATHQLFITNRTVYLFLTEAREESNYWDFTYWLNTISLFSNNSPVVVILSKVDESRKSLPESLYRERFSNIIDFVDLSCADGYEDTIMVLKRAIGKAIELLPQTRQQLPVNWVNIRNELEKLAAEKDYIDYAEYLKVCAGHRLNAVRADFLGQYLNDLGVIVHHQHDLLLKKTVFINPEWCTEGLYRVLDSKEVFNGRFTTDDLSTIWGEVRFAGKQAELLKLMCEYGLCFELRDGTGYIAPDLLEPDRPDTIVWENTDGLHFEIRYDFMPAGILSRFIVKSHAFIKNNFYWKYGVVLEYDDTEALVVEDYMHSKVIISLRGRNKRGLLSAVRMYIDEVHRDFDKFNKLQFEEMVPCNCAECRHSLTPHFFRFSVLRKYEQKMESAIRCEKSIGSVSVASLINDIQISRPQDFSTARELRWFITNLIHTVLRKEIMLKEGYVNFWRDPACTEPKNETEFQPYISTVLDNYCKVNGIQLTREAREGNGSVDIAFSYTNRDRQLLKVCLEIKKAHHQDVTSAMNTQLPVYMESMGTREGIYLVIWQKNGITGKPSVFANEEEMGQRLETLNQHPDNIMVQIINCCRPVSPSKR
ncbi:MAG TPA: COR domain-containing protein [Puia sp.]|jgi:small GTP-binding protein